MKILIIGATGILGNELTKQLVELLHDVTICGRNVSKIKSMVGNYGSKLNYLVLDMMNVKDIINISSDIISNKFDCIIFNQGIYENNYNLNEDGLESHFMVNAYSQYLLLKLILPKYDNLMVLTVSSISCYNRKLSLDLNSQNVKKWNLVYGNNKLLQLNLMKELEKEFTNIDFRYAHPGISYSPISSKLHSKFTSWFIKMFMMKPSEAVRSIIYAIYNTKKDYWSAPNGFCELIGKPKLKRIRKSKIFLDVKIKKKINLITKEIEEKYGI